MKNFIKNTIQSQKIFYRYLRKKGFKRFLKENILETDGSNIIKAKSIALGVFIGLTPLWGFHMIAVLFLASFLKLNKMISYLGTQISFPPFIPFIIFISMIIGAPFVGEKTNFTDETFDINFAKAHLLQYVVGSFILAVISSIVIGALSYLLLEKLQPSKSKASL